MALPLATPETSSSSAPNPTQLPAKMGVSPPPSLLLSSLEVGQTCPQSSMKDCQSLMSDEPNVSGISELTESARVERLRKKGTTVLSKRCGDNWLVAADTRVSHGEGMNWDIHTDQQLKCSLVWQKFHLTVLCGHLELCEIILREVRSFVPENLNANLKLIWEGIEGNIRRRICREGRETNKAIEEESAMVLVFDRRLSEFLLISVQREVAESNFLVMGEMFKELAIGSGAEAISNEIDKWLARDLSFPDSIIDMYEVMSEASVADCCTGGYCTVFSGGVATEWCCVLCRSLNSEHKTKCDSRLEWCPGKRLIFD